MGLQIRQKNVLDGADSRYRHPKPDRLLAVEVAAPHGQEWPFDQVVRDHGNGQHRGQDEQGACGHGICHRAQAGCQRRQAGVVSGDDEVVKDVGGKTDGAQSDSDKGAYDEDPNNPNQDHTLNVQNKGTNQNLENSEADADGYEKLTIPWSLSVNYSVRLGDGDKFDYEKLEYNLRLTHNLNFSGNIQLTPGWQISGTTSYDFEAKQFTYTSFNVTRNLHCWTLTGNFVPFGPYKTYNFRIGVNSSMLQDLKWEKQGNRESIQNKTVWY